MYTAEYFSPLYKECTVGNWETCQDSRYYNKKMIVIKQFLQAVKRRKTLLEHGRKSTEKRLESAKFKLQNN